MVVEVVDLAQIMINLHYLSHVGFQILFCDSIWTFSALLRRDLRFRLLCAEWFGLLDCNFRFSG